MKYAIAARDAAQPVPEPERRPIPIGLVGLGNNGQAHYAALTNPRQRNFALVAATDPNPKIDIGDVELVPGYDLLLARKDIAAVGINTPPYLHYEMTMSGLEAGKHVLVEKPPALTLEQCQTMIRTAEEKRKVLFFAFHLLYRPEIFLARRQLAGQAVQTIEIIFRENLLEYHDPHGWILDRAKAGGGVLMDSGINALSIVDYILPNVRLSVERAEFGFPDHFQVETAAAIQFTFGKGTEGHMELDGQHQGSEVRQISFGAGQDRYTVDIMNSQLIKNGKSIFGARPQLSDKGEYEHVYDDFARHIYEGELLASTKELAFILDAYGMRR